jgi:SAM-dependent methyltransferase
MDDLGKKELIQFYNKHLKEFGDSPLSLRWTPEGQRLRYETFLSVAGNLSGKSILDFGCGKGDFYGFLKKKGLSLKYTGVDINKNFINMAREKHPEARFLTIDIEESHFKEEFDMTFAIGVFNLKVPGIKESFKNCLKSLFSLSKEALHFDLLSTKASARDVELFYVEPEEILSFILQHLSRKVILRHGIIEGVMIISVYH